MDLPPLLRLLLDAHGARPDSGSNQARSERFPDWLDSHAIDAAALSFTRRGLAVERWLMERCSHPFDVPRLQDLRTAPDDYRFQSEWVLNLDGLWVSAHEDPGKEAAQTLTWRWWNDPNDLVAHHTSLPGQQQLRYGRWTPGPLPNAKPPVAYLGFFRVDKGAIKAE